MVGGGLEFDGVDDFEEVAAGHDPLVCTQRFGEEMGTTYSEAMKDAIVSTRFGGEFPTELAEQLPYPEVSSILVLEHHVAPSAALMQQSVYNPFFSPSRHDSYNDMVKRLHNVALPGYDLYAIKISANPGQNENEPEILYMGAHHGREMISVSVVMGLIERLVTKYKVDDYI